MLSLLLSLLLGAVPAHAYGGTLTVRSVPSSAGITAPRGAQRIPMLTLELEASCGSPVQMRSIKLHHEGLGSASDLSAVYAFLDGKRVTRAVTFAGRTPETTLRLDGLSLKPCEKISLQILIDLAADAAPNGQHAVVLSSPHDIDAGDAVVRLSLANAEAQARAAAITQGTISVTTLSLPRALSYGENRVIARIKLSADGIVNHAISAITFTNDGKARDTDVQDLWIASTRGERLTSLIPQMEGDKAHLIFVKPYLLQKNESVTFEVHADLFASRTRTIGLLIEEASDIESIPVKGRIKR
jgi:hypothetical protein